jgi:hypothetical protein
MKKSTTKYYFILVLIIFGYLFYPLPETTVLKANIKNTHHDFRGAAWSNGELCRPCHIPHGANTEVANSPLWSHELTSASYNVYENITLNATPGQPNGRSKLCLSCHDGTVAVENHSGNSSGEWFLDNETWRRGGIGTNLKNDHPISFTYNSALANADGELHDPSTTSSGLGGTIAEDLLEGGSLECSSCHDVHVARKTDEGCSGCHFANGGSIYAKTLSLRVDNEESAFCLTCHKK